MLFVLGAGFYTPENRLSDELLSSFGLAKPVGRMTTKERRTTLPLTLLSEDKNRDLVRSIKESSISCSEMGERAARQAIERAGIAVEQIGLVVADCATPIETTPAESQRVAGRLGLKVPAYDIYSTNGICPAHFSLIQKWKKDRVPAYVLCVSTNAPTQRVDYTKGSEGWVFSDGAAACVISLNQAAGLEILFSDYGVDASQSGPHLLDTLGHLVEQPVARESQQVQFEKALGVLTANQALWGNKQLDTIFTTIEDAEFFAEVAGTRRMAASYQNSLAEFGNMLGTNSFAQIAAQWDAFMDGQLLGVVVAQGSPGHGVAVFRVRK